LGESFADCQFVLPRASTLDASWLAAEVQRFKARRGRPLPEIRLCGDARAALRHSRAGIVASGTATVEAALIGSPFLVVYRVSPLSWSLGRRFVRVDHFAMANLVAGREVVPELIQRDFTPGNVRSRLGEMLAEGPVRERIIAGLAEVRHALRPGAQSAADLTAETIAHLLPGGGV